MVLQAVKFLQQRCIAVRHRAKAGSAAARPAGFSLPPSVVFKIQGRLRPAFGEIIGVEGEKIGEIDRVEVVHHVHLVGRPPLDALLAEGQVKARNEKIGDLDVRLIEIQFKVLAAQGGAQDPGLRKIPAAEQVAGIGKGVEADLVGDAFGNIAGELQPQFQALAGEIGRLMGKELPWELSARNAEANSLTRPEKSILSAAGAWAKEPSSKNTAQIVSFQCHVLLPLTVPFFSGSVRKRSRPANPGPP